ncbi:hypothetical protein ES703_76684 [subsurface metagenome]
MNEAMSKGSSSLSNRKTLFLPLAGVAICLSLLIPYFLEIISLGTVFVVIITPLLLWLFFTRREAMLLALIAAYFGAGYFFPDLLVQGLIRGLFLALIGVTLLLELGIKKGIRRISTPLDKVLVLWLIVVLISFIHGFYVRHNDAGYLFGDMYKFSEVILVFWLTTFVVKSSRQVKFLIWGFLLMVVVFGAVDSMKFFRQAYFVSDILLARVRAGAQFSSIFALVLAVSLILHERRTITKAILMFLSLALFISFILAFLRTGYIVLPPTLVFILLLHSYKRGRYAITGIARFTVWVVFLGAFTALFSVILTSLNPDMDLIQTTQVRFSTLVTPGSEDPMGVRMLEVQSIISQVLTRNPLLGNGLGGEYYGFTQVGGELKWGLKHFVHNNYFDFAIRTGTLGLAVFLILAFRYLRDGIRFYLRSKSSFYSGVLVGCIGIFIGSSVIALSTSIFYSPFLFAIMAMTYCVAYLEKKEHQRFKSDG